MSVVAPEGGTGERAVASPTAPRETRPRLLDRGIVASMIVGVAVFALLAAFVAADPATGVTRSASPWADEGFNSIGARNLILLGHFSTDQWNVWLVNLPFTVTLAAVFELFGTGIVQARLLMVAATALTAFALAAGLRRPFGGWAATVVAIAFSTSILTLFYGRLVYLENLQVLALAVGVLTLARLDDGRPRLLGAIAGVAFAVAIGVKPNAVFAVAGVIVFVAVGAGRSSRAVRQWLAAGVALVVLSAIAWALIVALPHLEMLRADLRILAPITWPTSLRELVSRIVEYPGADGDYGLRLIAPLLLAGAAGLLVSVVRWRQLDPAAHRLIFAALGWFAVSVGVLFVVDYRPNRYLYPDLAALAILAAPAVDAALGVVRNLAVSRAPRRSGALHVAAAAVICGALAAHGLYNYARWVSQATYDLPGIQAEMARSVPAGSVVVGPDAPTFLMAAPVTVVVPNWGGPPPVNTGDLYVQLGARWYITNEGADAQPVATQHPAQWQQREAAACAAWYHGRLCLYRLP